MQVVKIPVADNGAIQEAVQALPNNSQLYNKETKTLFVKKDGLIPVGSEVAYTKGVDAFYFCGAFQGISDWPEFGYTAVIYLSEPCQIKDELKGRGFYVNIGKEEPDWKPFCEGDFNANNILHVGAIIQFFGETIPEGYLPCNGQTVLKEDYVELWETFGSAWGFLDLNQTEFTIPLLNNENTTYIIKAFPSTQDLNIGSIYLYEGAHIPNGYLLCDGRSLPILENFELFLRSGGKTQINENEFTLPNLSNEYTKYIVKAKNVVELPVGIMVGYPRNFIPQGFLDCDGSFLSKFEFFDLFNEIKTKYGATAATFGLPRVDNEYISFAIKTGKII